MRVKLDLNGAGLAAGDLASLLDRWKDLPARVAEGRAAGKHGYLDVERAARDAEALDRFFLERRGRWNRMVQLGIGGSALGNIAAHRALGGRDLVDVVDNVDPEKVQESLRIARRAGETVYHVVTKSGETAETLAQLSIVIDALKRQKGDRWREYLIVSTDPQKGTLREIVRAEGLPSFEVPPPVGGRFSFLTPVGLASCAFAGIGVERVVRGAATAAREGLAPGSAALAYAAILHRFHEEGRRTAVFWPYSDALYGVADWWRQLLAESLGKRGETGPLPIPALGATDQHSVLQLYMEGPPDKWFTFVEVEKFRREQPIPAVYAGREAFSYLAGRTLGELLRAEKRGTEHALREAGRPCCTLVVPAIDEETFGELLYTLALSVTYAGAMFGLDPYDQPGVEAGKKATYALMGRAGYETRREEIERKLKCDKALVL